MSARQRRQKRAVHQTGGKRIVRRTHSHSAPEHVKQVVKGRNRKVEEKTGGRVPSGRGHGQVKIPFQRKDNVLLVGEGRTILQKQSPFHVSVHVLLHRKSSIFNQRYLLIFVLTAPPRCRGLLILAIAVVESWHKYGHSNFLRFRRSALPEISSLQGDFGSNP